MKPVMAVLWSVNKLSVAALGQTWSYIFFGILTTVVNFISYLLFTKWLGLDYRISASLAWVLAVVFAYFTNKFFVFKADGTKGIQLIKEFLSFLFYRTLSYFIDLLSIIVLVEQLKVLDTVSKIIASAIVAIFNYFASKYIIFRFKPKTGE